MATITLINPGLWENALRQFDSIRPNEWLDTACIDFYLVQFWLHYVQAGRRNVQYIPMHFARLPTISQTKPTNTEVVFFRGSNRSVTGCPIITIIHHALHFFVAIFCYNSGRAWILGSAAPWSIWLGPKVWVRLARLLGLATIHPSNAVHISYLNWVGDGINCGADATSCVQAIIRKGLTFSVDGSTIPPIIHCAHRIRAEILRVCIAGAKAQVVLYQPRSAAVVLAGFHEADEELMAKVIQGYEKQPIVIEIAAELQAAESTCETCMDKDESDDGLGEDIPDAEPADIDKAALQKTKVKYSLLKAVLPVDHGRTRRLGHLIATPRRSSQHHPTVSAIIVPPALWTLPPSNPSHYVENYNAAPFVDVAISSYQTMLADGPTLQTLWQRYADHGFRPTRAFHASVNHAPPVMAPDHFLAVPPNTNTPLTLRELGGDDYIDLSMEEMLEMAGEAGSVASHSVFVLGLTPDRKKSIRLDVARDAVDILPDEINIKVDIDSLNYTTRKPVSLKSINLFTTPNYSDPHINTNPHLFADILLPRDDIQAANNEGLSRSFYLSSFAQLPFMRQGTQIITTILFPRMLYNGGGTKKIPPEQQVVWYDKVIIPCLLAVSDNDEGDYLNYTVKERQNKARGSRGISESTEVLTPKQLDAIVDRMHEIIDNSPNLAQFGSFFFHTDGRGFKHQTKCGERDPLNPLEKLTAEFDYLDFEHMSNLRNGMLTVDIGVKFSAPPEKNAAGIFRLDKLAQSYQHSGMSSPKVHHTSDFAGYGGMQGELPRARARTTHCIFRSSYALVWEVNRPKHKAREVIDDRDAYRQSGAYKNQIESLISAGQSAANKDGVSYGLRDEIRVTYAAAKHIFPHVWQKARAFCRWHPFVWKDRAIFFAFNQRRITEMDECQKIAYALNRPNYGITTLVLCRMIKSCISTPIVKFGLLRKALMGVQLEINRDRWGITFLPGLDISNGKLEGVSREDCYQTRVYLDRRSLEAKRTKELKAPAAEDRTSFPNSENRDLYPIGPFPSWEHVVTALTENPVEFVKPWQYNSDWNSNQDASRVFVQMAQEIWEVFHRKSHPDFAHKPHIVDLKSAMEAFSVAGINKAVRNPLFEPISEGLDGPIRGRRTLGSSARRAVYFPQGIAVDGTPNDFQPFAKRGYLRTYYNIMSHRDSTGEMLAALDKIFEHVQCLHQATAATASAKPTLCSGTRFTFKANPHFYKIEGVSASTASKPAVGKTQIKPGLKDIDDVLGKLHDEAGDEQGVSGDEPLRKRQKISGKSKGTKNRRLPPPCKTK